MKYFSRINQRFYMMVAIFIGILVATIAPHSALAQVQAGTLASNVANDARLTTLNSAIEQANLTDMLTNNGPFTLFAPTNAAFAALPEGTLEALLQDNTLLRQTLLNHIIPGRNRVPRLGTLGSVRSALGQNLQLATLADGTVQINGRVNLIVTNIRTDNGTLHLVDAVIAPEPGLFDQALPKVRIVNPNPNPPAEVDPNGNSLINAIWNDARFSQFRQLVEQTELVNLLNLHGPFTVYAPTNEAIAKIPAETLANLRSNNNALRQTVLYHIVRGNPIGMVNTALGKPITVNATSINGSVQLVGAPIVAQNGTVQAIDTLLLPPAQGSFQTNVPVRQPGQNAILDTLQADGRFDTFVMLLETTGLQNLLTRRGAVTVFAPTDEVWEDLPDGTLEFFLQNQTNLRHVLLAHIAIGANSAAELQTVSSIETALGVDVPVSVQNGAVFLNNRVQVVQADVPAGNGVIHVVDKVLIPSSFSDFDGFPPFALEELLGSSN